MTTRINLGTPLLPATILPAAIVLLAGTILLLAATGCDAAPDSSPTPQSQVEDSAGISIIEKTRPTADSRLGWRVSPEPLVSIGTAEGTDDFQLHWVDDALRLNDGRIVVANGGSHQLLVFDGAGNYLTAWGQRGEGPGDFGGSMGSDGLTANLFWMERWPGDSLAVCHAGPPVAPKHLVSILDTQGRYGRRLNLARGNDVPKCRDLLPGGSILASRWLGPSPPHPPEEPERGLYRRELELFIVADDGSPKGTLGAFPGAETFWYWEDAIWDGTAFAIMSPPFQKSLVWAAWGEFVAVAPTERYELRAYRHDGSLARIVRRDTDVRSPTQADLEGRQAAEAPEGDLTDFARNRMAAWNALPLPESFPTISAIEVDLLGNLWVREYNLPGEEGRALWSVFDPDGLVLGFVETPPELVIYEIGEDHILGKVRDELGVEYVQVWGLDRSG